jgi:putative ATP-binding cassette transporter
MGKSTLIKAIGGLWNSGSGRISIPMDLMILPQRVYIPIDGPPAAAVYPAAHRLAPEALDTWLHALGLDPQTVIDPQASSKSAQASRSAPTGSALSGGEQQRLMLARLLVAKPRYAILDEPTGALDERAEVHVFSTLQTLLPHTTFIVVSHHRPPCLTFRHEVWLEDKAQSGDEGIETARV